MNPGRVVGVSRLAQVCSCTCSSQQIRLSSEEPWPASAWQDGVCRSCQHHCTACVCRSQTASQGRGAYNTPLQHIQCTHFSTFLVPTTTHCSASNAHSSFQSCLVRQLGPTCQQVLQPILLAPCKHVLPKKGMPQDVGDRQPRQRLPSLPLLDRRLGRPLCSQPDRLQMR